jgi:PKD repeat protein
MHHSALAACAVSVLFLSVPGTAQEVPFTCLTNDPVQLAEIHGNDVHRVQHMHEAEQALEAFTREFTAQKRGGDEEIVIPVVFHIIHENGLENISDDQVRDAIRVLNNDFNKLNTDWTWVQPEFLDIVADVGVSFRLATLDPSGNCTKGITRTVSSLTNEGDSEMKDLIIWPRNRYMNVWVCAYANGAAGYTNYPSSVDGAWGAATDGIVMKHDYIGTIGTSTPGRSRTLTHEVGHWINLRHAWGNSNDPGEESNCDMDDGVEDTPNTIGWTTCALFAGSCGSPKDNVENYMEYSYCSKMFTNGQKARMLAALNSSTAQRDNLWTLSNRALTGTLEDPTLCAADLTSDVRITCVGNAVQFQDLSYNHVTEWNWTFPGGEPASSTEQDPLVTYAAPGVYPVQLQVGDGVNVVSAEMDAYITVLSDPGLALPFTDDFEATMLFPNDRWTVFDSAADGTFQLSSSAAFSGDNSVFLDNHGTAEGSVDEFVSTSLDLSDLVEPPVLSFRYAYVQRQSTNDDQLRVYISRDCGATWSLRALLRGINDLPTAPIQNSPFTPDGPSEWGYKEVTNIGVDFLESDVRIKFWSQSDGGNNIWIDDININGLHVGLAEQAGSHDGLSILPNPAGEEAMLLADLTEGGNVQVDVLDATGRVAAAVTKGRVTAGVQRWSLPMQQLSSGVYLVRVQENERSRIVRLVKR